MNLRPELIACLFAALILYGIISSHFRRKKARAYLDEALADYSELREHPEPGDVYVNYDYYHGRLASMTRTTFQGFLSPHDAKRFLGLMKLKYVHEVSSSGLLVLFAAMFNELNQSISINRQAEKGGFQNCELKQIAEDKIQVRLSLPRRLIGTSLVFLSVFLFVSLSVFVTALMDERSWTFIALLLIAAVICGVIGWKTVFQSVSCVEQFQNSPVEITERTD